MMERPFALNDQVDLVSSDDEVAAMETDSSFSVHNQTTDVHGSEVADDISFSVNKQTTDIHGSEVADGKSSEGSLFRRAKMYQEYMKKVSIPPQRGSIIPCTSWMGLAKSIKALYGQPLHYLTNILLKKWDQARFETGEDFQPLDTVVHPLKAETTIWLIEEVHRQTASCHQLAKLWLADPMHRAFVDPIFAKLA